MVSSFGIKFLRLIRQSQADQRISGSSLARFLRHGCLICLARGSDSLIGTSESRSTSNKQRRYYSSGFQRHSQNFLCTSDITLRNTLLIEWHITFRDKREGKLKGIWKFFRYEGPIYFFFLRCWFFKAYAVYSVCGELLSLAFYPVAARYIHLQNYIKKIPSTIEKEIYLIDINSHGKLNFNSANTRLS